jgi:hypothetical protein
MMIFMCSRNFVSKLAWFLFVSIVGALGCTLVNLNGNISQTVRTLRVLSSNPRYFTDGSGKPVYLTGSHTWSNMRDRGLTDPPPIFDFNGYLDLLQSNGHNFIRLWAWDLSKTNSLNEDDDGIYYVIHFPWPRTGPGTALDGKPKFDLSKLDQAYFDRLRQRVIEARNHGIYVSIMLFEGWALQHSESAWRWNGHPMHAANNINGIDGDPNNDGYGIESQTLPGPTGVNAIQKAYMRKVVDTVNDLDNVLYEIVNESGNYSTKWQYDFIASIRSYQSAKPKQHPIGMTYQWSGIGYSGSDAELFNSPADWISPRANLIGDGRKVVIADTDHINAFERDPAWVWKSFLSGVNPIVMDHYNGSQWDPIRAAMGDARSYADRMNLALMSPQDCQSSTGYCLSAAGSEYLIYQPQTGSFHVNLQAGTYNFEWFNPGTGAVTNSGSITVSSDSISFSAPFSGHAVLYLKSGTLHPNSVGNHIAR